MQQPIFRNQKIRFIVGLTAFVATLFLMTGRINQSFFKNYFFSSLVFGMTAWIFAIWLTDRYVHKYPQRYYTYLIACILKGIITASAVTSLFYVLRIINTSQYIDIIWSILIASLIDAVLSIPNSRSSSQTKSKSKVSENISNQANVSPNALELINLKKITRDNRALLDVRVQRYFESLELSETGNDVLCQFSDEDFDGNTKNIELAGVLSCDTSLNEVKRLDRFLRTCVSQIIMGGYMVATYRPLDLELTNLRRNSSRIAYPFRYLWDFVFRRAVPKIPFLDKVYFSNNLEWIDELCMRLKGGRNRALAKAETWGRFAYYGLEIVFESVDNDGAVIIAQRVSPPVANREPSYYAVVGLEKVGLGGEIFRLHKVRSMYPFSEFLQKKIFQSHGLSNTGKFNNDFRLTDYGPMIRKNWIDEIPGIYDWFRGEIKLVGMRATSPHYLSLYPRAVYDLYIQVKPGLIPPIFDEKTTGFEDIVLVEKKYLMQYLKDPIKTDLLYFWYTFRDIFIRRVRSS